VTAGGVDTDELSAKTMESAKYPGSFLSARLSTSRPTRRFNFQWAWASGAAAGRVCDNWILVCRRLRVFALSQVVMSLREPDLNAMLRPSSSIISQAIPSGTEKLNPVSAPIYCLPIVLSFFVGIPKLKLDILVISPHTANHIRLLVLEFQRKKRERLADNNIGAERDVSFSVPDGMLENILNSMVAASHFKSGHAAT